MKKFAMHKGTDVRIVEVRETPVFYIFEDHKFKKESQPTPDLIASGYGRRGTFRNHVLSEINAPVVKEKLLINKRRTLTREFVSAVEKKFNRRFWLERDNNYITIEQAKHLNDYLSLGMEIEE